MEVSVGLLIALGAAFAFAFTNGFHDASNAIATLVVTRGAGTALGGWRIVKTVGRDIYRIKPLDGLSSQSASAAVIFGASLLGGPVSTTHVVASSVVGVGGGRRRWHHIHWAVVRAIGLTWLTTIPATALLAAVAVSAWRGLA
jgi:inorganic phosphate transporter, PiT family